MLIYLIIILGIIGALTGAAYWLDDNGYDRAMAEVRETRNKEKLQEKTLLLQLADAKSALEAQRGKSQTTIIEIKHDCMEVLLRDLDPTLPKLLDDAGGKRP